MTANGKSELPLDARNVLLWTMWWISWMKAYMDDAQSDLRLLRPTHDPRPDLRRMLLYVFLSLFSVP